MRSVLFLLFSFFIVIHSSGQQMLVLSDTVLSNDVSKSLRFAVDEDFSRNINTIRTDSVCWQTFKGGEVPNMGIKKQPVWFAFTMQNSSNIDDWILHIDYWTLDSVSVFVFNSADSLVFADMQGISTKNIHNQRMPLFALTPIKNEVLKVYIRIQTSSMLIVPVSISTPMALFEAENNERDGYLLALGILMAAVLFNLALFITSKEKAYLFLALSIAALVCFIVAIIGFLYNHINFSNPLILQRLRFVFIGLTYGLHALFVINYLNLKNYKTVRGIEIGASIYFLGFSLLSGAGLLSAYVCGVILTTGNMAFLFIQFSIAIYLSIKRAPMALSYLISFTPVAISLLIFIAEYNSWIEENVVVHNASLYASGLFSILLTSGLTEKMLFVRRETARANQLAEDKIALETEIMQRKQVEVSLKESELRFRSLFELSPLPIVLTDLANGTIVDTNLAFCDITGFSRRHILGKSTFSLGLIDEAKRSEIVALVSKSEQLAAYETELTIKGKPRIAHLFMSILYIGDEKLLVTLVSDITTQKESEARLQELNVTKDKFLSIIAHDLVNPFHAMIMYSKELKAFTSGNSRAESYNANLLLTAQNTYNLLQNLLTWVRTQNKQISFNPQPINLGEIVHDAVDYAQTMAVAKQIEIVNNASNEFLVEADGQMINTVLRNLISNSIKFSFKQAVVKLISSEDAANVYISVIDYGTGMEAFEREKLFDLGKTIQHPGTSGEPGTGLGLVICREFVTCHGGTIAVESWPGMGSSFTISLPKKHV